MSVDLLFWNLITQKGRSIPLAGQRDFEKYWVPLASSLSLLWVPTFNYCPNIKREDIVTIVDEFEQIQATLSTNPPSQIPEHEIQIILRRIPWIIDALKNAPQNPEIEISFG